MRLCLFQFSLRDQASNWLECLLVVFITTWEDLTTRFLAQFFPSGRTAKLRNDILMFQQHHGESLSEAWTRFKDLLQKVPHQGINLWLQAAIEKLSQYEDEGWNDPVDLEEGSLNYEKPDIEQLLGVMEYKVDALMKDAISLMGRSEGLFSMTSNEIYQLPPEPSRQEEFEHFVMNFILDQEERVKKLEEYMRVIASDFMQLSSEVTRRLKEKIRGEGSRIRKIEKITKYPDMEVLEPLAGHKFLENLSKKMFHDTFKSIPMNSLWIRYVQLNFSNPLIFRKSTFGFKLGKSSSRNVESRRDDENSPTTQYDPEHNSVKSRLGGEPRDMSLLELGWRVMLHTERRSRDNATLNGLSRAKTVKVETDI
ncbi:zinc finger, CCHC-type containing protein [Tanacetum coccineum]